MNRLRTRLLRLPASAALALLLVAAPGLASDGLSDLMKPYDTLHAALAGDTLEGVATSAKQLAETARKLTDDLDAETAGVDAERLPEVRSQLETVENAAKALAGAETLDAARKSFGEVSTALVAWRGLAGNGPAVAFCPMAGKRWLETDTEELENPYYGSSMLHCGTFETK